MISLQRNKRVLYLCKKYVDNNLTKYKKPISIKINYQPISTTGEIISLGIEYIEYLKVVGTPKEISQFSNMDRCYVYEKPSKIHDNLCENADFYVDGEPVITLNEAYVRLKRLTGAK